MKKIVFIFLKLIFLTQFLVFKNSFAMKENLIPIKIQKFLIPFLKTSGFSQTQKSKILEFDFNKDQILDFVVLVDKKICDIKNSDFKCNKNLNTPNESSQRKLLIYFGNKSGGYDLFLETINGLLNFGEGEKQPDPFKDLILNNKGTISIGFSGGADLKWSFEFKIQYRQVDHISDFYVIGLTQTKEQWSAAINTNGSSILSKTIDKNLITGLVVETNKKVNDSTDFKKTSNSILNSTSKSVSKPEAKSISKIQKKQPLVKIRNADQNFIYN